MRHPLAARVLIAAAALAIAWLTASSKPGQRLEYAFADLGASALLHEVDSDIVIIAIDAKSLADLQQWPWPRRYHAELMARIAPAQPAKLFFDIDFSSRTDEHNDRSLATALAEWPAGSVILPAFYQQRSPEDSELVLTEPLPALRQHAVAGSVNLRPGPDGLVRTVQSNWYMQGKNLPAVSSLLGAGADTAADYWIDFTIDPASFQVFSYSDVLANRVPAQYFAGKSLFVGATAIELGDIIPVPVHQALPGVVVQALATESLRAGPREPLAGSVYWALVAAWTLLLVFACFGRTWRRNGLIVALTVPSVFAAALYAYTSLHVIVFVLPFAVSAVSVYLVCTLCSLESETLRALMLAIGLRKRDALLKSIVQSSTDCIVCIDSRGVIRTANPAALNMFARRSPTLNGESMTRFVPGLLDGSAGEPWQALEQLAGKVVEQNAMSDMGEEFPAELSISRVRFDDERLYTAIIRDISERQAQQHQLQFQATHDPLTTLPNRPALAAHLDSVLQSRNASGNVALLMIDLNRFKEVNDTLGHNIGDYVLHEVARRLGNIADSRGFIARIGGDEFALVVASSTSQEALSALSGELVDCLKEPIETCGIAIEIGLSIGIAMYPGDAKSAEELFQHSDVAMYVAKRGNSGFEFYDSAADQNSLRRLAIASKLRSAIANDELQLHYQPQVNLTNGRVESVEALLRWNDRVLGFIGPDEFITLAETTDLIQPLSAWTLVQGFRQAAQWQNDGLDLRVAINISARLLQDVSFPARVAELMQDCEVEPQRIELEITESAMMLDPERALRVTEALSALGVFISIDDYGTGYSSLAYLRDLPAHALKLDKSFVLNMQQQDGDRIIAASTVHMAHALNMKIVAEGVETSALAELLRELGYDYAQGYLYSPALEADALTMWIREYNDAQLQPLPTAATNRA